jgi:hypothetical protein
MGKVVENGIPSRKVKNTLSLKRRHKKSENINCMATFWHKKNQ